LLDLFLEFLIVFAIGDFRGFPRFAKHEPGLFAVHGPQRVGYARQRSRAECLILKGARVGRECNQECPRLLPLYPYFVRCLSLRSGD